LVGHATLASAHILFTIAGIKVDEIRFKTLSGDLFVTRHDDGMIQMDFPQGYCKEINFSQDILTELCNSIEINIEEIIGTHFDDNSGKLIIETSSMESILRAKPNAAKLFKVPFPVPVRGISLTTCCIPDSKDYRNCDFASRYFSPWNGILEDPVNGSSHTILSGFYQNKLHKDEFLAYMASERTGFLHLKLLNAGRILVCGYAITTLVGAILL